MSNWKKEQEKRYDPALEAQAELERGNKRAHWIALILEAIGAVLVVSVAKLHFSTLAGKLAGISGPLCFIAAWMVSTWVSSRQNGPEYVSISQPKGPYRTRR